MSVDNAPTLHAEALAWLRFAKRMPIVCTEGGGFNADVLGVDALKVIEVEVKVSASDMRAEFKNKQLKHEMFRWSLEKKQRTSSFVPNFWWMIVDKSLEQKALSLLAEEAPYGGVLVRERPSMNQYAAGRWNLRVARQPKRLHPEHPRPMLVRSAIMRMANEVVGWNLTSGLKFEGVTPGEVSRVITQRMEGVEGVLDVEDADPSLERRGLELAWVMGKDWSKLGSQARMKWCLRAQQFMTMRRGPALESEREAI